jgi:hypothetical protein
MKGLLFLVVIILLVFSIANYASGRLEVSQRTGLSVERRIRNRNMAAKTDIYRFNGPNRKQWIAFIEGFALGLESDFGNVTECTQDAKLAFTTLERSFQELRDGFKRNSVYAITAGLIDLGFGIKELIDDAKACDIKEIIDDVLKIAHELSSGVGGIIEVVIKETINIFSHHREITNDFKNLILFWEQQKYELAGVQLGKLVGLLLKA